MVSVWVLGNAGNDQERLELTASGGADCSLQDFRFIVSPGRDLQLVTAQRESGTSFTDVADVTFTYFSLKRNSADDTGRPLYYFESTTSTKAKAQYCDVNEAFKQELGLQDTLSGVNCYQSDGHPQSPFALSVHKFPFRVLPSSSLLIAKRMHAPSICRKFATVAAWGMPGAVGGSSGFDIILSHVDVHRIALICFHSPKAPGQNS